MGQGGVQLVRTCQLITAGRAPRLRFDTTFIETQRTEVHTMSKVRIKRTAHPDGTRAAYKGNEMIATIHRRKPNACNARAALYNVAWLTGRVDWHNGGFSLRRTTHRQHGNLQ